MKLHPQIDFENNRKENKKFDENIEVDQDMVDIDIVSNKVDSVLGEIESVYLVYIEGKRNMKIENSIEK